MRLIGVDSVRWAGKRYGPRAALLLGRFGVDCCGGDDLFIARCCICWQMCRMEIPYILFGIAAVLYFLIGPGMAWFRASGALREIAALRNELNELRAQLRALRAESIPVPTPAQAPAAA
ncbi:MAG: hypothetical protein NTV80_06280, partial [Verrucomicrobia bacterium]|nr:hypothetical protein [Verrucomicrobiota bacterium]